MGWFWADSSRPTAPVAPHPLPTNSNASPPPSCPMHEPNSPSPPFPSRQNTTSSASSCPIQAPNHPLRNYATPSATTTTTTSTPPPPSPQPSLLSKYNPLNLIPSSLTNTAAPTQTYALPLNRETSSIPRGSDPGHNWEYPSPQQMYNAMQRKGYTDTPIDAVEAMVAVHNFLNEGAWAEIVEWESLFRHGLWDGWSNCSRGEAHIQRMRMMKEASAARRARMGMAPPQQQQQQEAEEEPKLLRFRGRPQEPTPKARILQVLGKTFPESFGSEAPFDRHDWTVLRTMKDGRTKEVRYVIDYYTGGLQESGEPVFYLDIRPALDTPTAAVERVVRWGGDVWWRAKGQGVSESIFNRSENAR